jgi:TonB family protein
MKIPAWLEPLASNASAPSSTQELVLREKAKRRAEQPTLEQMTAPLVAPAEKVQVAESRVPQFGSALPFEEVKSAKESSPKKSGKGMLFGALAAGILLLAGGGWWYINQQAAGVHASVPAMQAPAASAASQDSPSNSTKEAALGSTLSTHGDTAASESKPVAANSNTSVNSVNSLSSSAPAGPTAAVGRKPQAVANSLHRGNDVPNADAAPPERESVAEKKPALGEVHLAAPKISQKRVAQTGAEPDAGISLSSDQPEASADSLSAGLGIANKQPAAPAAPVAVGGDVKQAKLISSVPPVYPAMAKAQHVSGGVTIDALIDASGRVTTMKVMSGPTLLQQAAMDALKQWRYQPATLDGKTVPMHLIVTIQFRFQ